VEEPREVGLKDYAERAELVLMTVHFIRSSPVRARRISAVQERRVTDFCRGPTHSSTGRVK